MITQKQHLQNVFMKKKTFYLKEVSAANIAGLKKSTCLLSMMRNFFSIFYIIEGTQYVWTCRTNENFKNFQNFIQYNTLSG